MNVFENIYLRKDVKIMTRAEVLQKTTNEFLKWVGYTEKNSKSDLAGRDYDNPGDYNEHAGSKNFTVFADLYKEKTGINVQGQAWCDTFVDTIFIHLYGVDNAKQLLGGFSAYTPTSANYFKNMGRWHTSGPKEGDVIFFKNSTRIYHTGYVYSADSKYVYTVEGNTSTTDNTVEENGGCVAKKKYLLTNSKIAGYGRPDYDLLASIYKEGWMKAADNKRWWYQFADGRYALNDGKNNGWYQFNGFWYLFDTNGYMLTGLQNDRGNYYFLCDEAGSDEGKLMTSYSNTIGTLKPWNTDKNPNDSGKVEGWLKAADGKRWWYQFADGSYAKNDGTNNGWYIINGHYYMFDADGYMLTGKQTVNGNQYYLCDIVGPDEGKLLTTYGNDYGMLTPWNTNK